MSLMDLFNRPAPTAAPVSNSPQSSPAPGPNPPAPSPAPNAPAPAPVDPMAAYSKMWDNPTKADKAPEFKLDPKIMDDVVSQQDFTQGADPEVLAKAKTGDIAAMFEIMQHSNRQAYRAALTHGSTLTDRFVAAREGYNEKNMGTRVRGELTSHELATTPGYANPVVRQQLHDTAERLQRQNPDMQPAEIAKMTKDYFNNLVNAINPATAPDPKKTAGPTDWDTFFKEDPEEL